MSRSSLPVGEALAVVVLAVAARVAWLSWRDLSEGVNRCPVRYSESSPLACYVESFD